MRTSSLIFMIFLPLHLFASTEFAGNGGDVVVCPDDFTFQTKLLDIYEEQVFNPGFEFDLGPDSLSFSEKINFNLAKLQRLSPYRFHRYQKDLEEFFDRVFWVEKQAITEIPDSLHVVLPENCELKQIALQLKKDNIHGKRYLIVKSLWDELPQEEKIALLFHEVIYREAVELGHRNSVEVRKLTAWILDRRFRDVDRAEFAFQLNRSGFPIETPQGIYPGRSFKYSESFPSGNLKMIIVDEPSKLFVGNHYLEMPVGTRIEFRDDRNNSVKRIAHFLFSSGKVSGYVEINGQQVTIKNITKNPEADKMTWFEMLLDENSKVLMVSNQQELF